jgi:uncharacterized phage-like protein YoqJ
MVTGHRKLVPAGMDFGSPWPDQNKRVEQHHNRIRASMMDIVNQWHRESGHVDFISGMALGADILFAEAVLEVKKMDLPVRLIAAVPFAGQERNWPAKSQARFRGVLSRADHVEIVSSGAYSPKKMQIRNVWMVDRSMVVLAIWDGAKHGGTWNCIQYALQQGKWVVQLHPQTFQYRVLEKGILS